MYFCNIVAFTVLKKALFIISFLILGVNCFSQNKDCSIVIEGQIKTNDRDEFQFLRVILTNPFKSEKIAPNGSFKIKNTCKGQNIIELRYLGGILKTDTIDIQGDTLISYNIESEAFQLPMIEIKTKKLLEQSFEEDKLTEDEIAETRGETLGEILENISGVSTLKTGNSISKPMIQGLHSNRILILNNGIRQEGQQWGSEHAPEVDPNMANSISVVKGASSIKYGYDAIGGLILIDPKIIGDSTRTEGEVNLAGFSNGRQGFISGVVSSRLKKVPSLSLMAQGSLKRGGNYHTPNYYLKNSGIREYNFSTAINFDKKKYGVNFFYSQFNTDLAIFSGSHIGNLTDLQFAFAQNEPIEKADFSYNIARPNQHIEHELTKVRFYYLLNDKSKISLTYGRQYNLRYEFDKHESIIDSIAALNRPDLHLELTSHTLDLNWKKNFAKGLNSEFGLSIISQKNTYTGRMFIPNYQNEGGGLFWLLKKSYDDLIIEGGARFDYRKLQSFYWKNNEIVSPVKNYSNYALNIGAKYRFNASTSISYNISKTWRPPSVNELYSDGLHHGAASIERGDENLEEENSINTNISFLLNKDKFRFEASPYFNYFSNYIFMEPELPPTLTIMGAFPTFNYTQAKVIITGIDLSAQLKLTKNLWINNNTSVIRGYNRSISDYLIQMPSDRTKNKLIYRIKDFESFKKTEFSVTHTFVDKQTRIPINTDFAPTPASYQLIDFMATTQINLNTPIKLSFGINNLLNNAYRDYLNRFRYYADEIGRNFIIRIKINFN